MTTRVLARSALIFQRISHSFLLLQHRFLSCFNTRVFIKKKRSIPMGRSGMIEAFFALVATVNHVTIDDAPIRRLLKTLKMGLTQDNVDSGLTQPSQRMFWKWKLGFWHCFDVSSMRSAVHCMTQTCDFFLWETDSSVSNLHTPLTKTTEKV